MSGFGRGLVYLVTETDGVVASVFFWIHCASSESCQAHVTFIELASHAFQFSDAMRDRLNGGPGRNVLQVMKSHKANGRLSVESPPCYSWTFLLNVDN